MFLHDELSITKGGTKVQYCTIFSWSLLEIPLHFYLTSGNSTCYFIDTPGNPMPRSPPPPSPSLLLYLAGLMMVSFKMGYQYFTCRMSIISHQDRELWLCFIFVNHNRNAFLSSIRMCAAFRKLWVWEKICSKFVKPWEMKYLLWHHVEKGSETMWDCEIWEV